MLVWIIGVVEPSKRSSSAGEPRRPFNRRALRAFSKAQPRCSLSTLPAKLPWKLIPELWKARTLPATASCGVNRISVGVQSFQPHLLKFLGRVHSADEAVKALQVIGDAGFENFSLDLIYANPAQTLRDLENDLDTALGFQSPHLSAYNLTIEEGTPFHHEYRSGRISLLSEEEEIAMAELIERRLSDAGCSATRFPTTRDRVFIPDTTSTIGRAAIISESVPEHIATSVLQIVEFTDAVGGMRKIRLAI